MPGSPNCVFVSCVLRIIHFNQHNIIIASWKWRFSSLYYCIFTHIQICHTRKNKHHIWTHHSIIRMILIRTPIISAQEGGNGEKKIRTKQDSMIVNDISNIINNLRFPTRSSILKKLRFVLMLRNHFSNFLNHRNLKIHGIWKYLWDLLTNLRNLMIIFISEPQNIHLYKIILQTMDKP